jgi:Uncharacterized anaerobic dehydrogenase
MWYGRDILEISKEDAEKLSIADGGLVTVKSKKGSVTLNAKIGERVMKGVVATTFHFPELKTNVLTSEYADWSTETPEYKVTAVSISKADAPFASREFKPLFQGKRRNQIDVFGYLQDFFAVSAGYGGGRDSKPH